MDGSPRGLNVGRSTLHSVLGPCSGLLKSPHIFWLSVGIGQSSTGGSCGAREEWDGGIYSHNPSVTDHKLPVGPSSIIAHSCCVLQLQLELVEAELQPFFWVLVTTPSPGPFMPKGQWCLLTLTSSGMCHYPLLVSCNPVPFANKCSIELT